MRMRWKDLGVLWVLIGLTACWQGLNQPGLPREGDALLHAYRALEMVRMWQAGILYPRWAPDLAGGAGYPLFIFHAPLFPWSVAALSVGLGLPVEQAIKAVLIIATLAGSVGAYLLARRWRLSPAAGVTAGLAFGYMPFQLQQSNYPQYLAITLLPWLLVGVDGVLRGGGFTRRWLLALSVALLGLSHNLTALMGYFLAFSYILFMSILRKFDKRRVARTFITFAIGLGMALPYLGPSVIEIPLVHMERARTGVYEVVHHFRSLPQLLQLPPVRDERWGNRPLILTIGLHQILLAFPSLAFALPGRHRTFRAEALWGWLAGMMLLFLMTPASRSLWAIFPGLSYVQFPWRWLGPAGLIVALLIGWSIETLKSYPRWPFAFAVCLFLVLGTLGFVYDGGSRVLFGQATLVDLHRYEREQFYPGLTATGELFPKWVEGWPKPFPDVIRAYEYGEEPDRLDRTTLPASGMAQPLDLKPLDQSWEIRLPHRTAIRFMVLGFPGWVVLVDGQPVSTWVEARTGWLWAELPAGTHRVRLWFAGFWRWCLFDGVALGLWLGWPIQAIFRRRRAVLVPSAAPYSATSCEGTPQEGWEPSRWVTRGAALLFLLVFVLRFPYHLWAIARVPLDRPPGVDLSVQADFEGRIRLVGYQIDRWVAFPGEVVHLNLWWRPLIDLQEDAHVYVHGIPADRPFAVAQVFQSDHVHPADLPTRRWDPEKHYRDAHLLRIPPDVPPGPYRIRVGWYSGPGNSRWRVEESGADGVDLPWTLIVRRAIPDLPSAISFGGVLQLRGVEKPVTLQGGDSGR
ncbi:MAG: 6-pyruvoyl-tetrahydropterin synthase-related protein [Anaerolineae bacterium]|nr:6-pyruvoyl-tetrahydropterin synthase-related protein [Thermoflexus sp.]MDW8065655.1 6-pyruvoyl-tetrahydropterin synthase-related protein [Anaerolineae bacterium]